MADVLCTSTSNLSSTSSWTDDLDECPESGVGYAVNRVYVRNTSNEREQKHEFEDRYVYKKADESLAVYGLFDGHDGTDAAQFCSAQFPTIILELNEMEPKSDDKIKALLKQIFQQFERGFFEQQEIASILCERVELNQRLATGDELTRSECNQRLRTLDQIIATGTSALICVNYRDILYVANVGDSRLILVEKDDDGNYIVNQITTDHDLNNINEVARLRSIGIDVDKLTRNGEGLIIQRSTRCIGNYFVKSGYKEFNLFSNASCEPVLSEPEIAQPIGLDDHTQFMALMSHGLYKAMSDIIEASGKEVSQNQVNSDIADMIITEFRTQSSIQSVAQAVVNRVTHMHRNVYSSSDVNSDRVEDITLLIRNFNHPLVNGVRIKRPSRLSLVDESKFAAGQPLTEPLKITIDGIGGENQAPPPRDDILAIAQAQVHQALRGLNPPSVAVPATNSSTIENKIENDATLTSSNSSSGYTGAASFMSDRSRTEPLEFDESGRIKGYFQFNELAWGKLDKK